MKGEMVLKQKLDGQGRFDLSKVHLLANAYFKEYGVDFDETLPPVIPVDVLLIVFGMVISVG